MASCTTVLRTQTFGIMYHCAALSNFPPCLTNIGRLSVLAFTYSSIVLRSQTFHRVSNIGGISVLKSRTTVLTYQTFVPLHKGPSLKVPVTKGFLLQKDPSQKDTPQKVPSQMDTPQKDPSYIKSQKVRRQKMDFNHTPSALTRPTLSNVIPFYCAAFSNFPVCLTYLGITYHCAELSNFLLCLMFWRGIFFGITYHCAALANFLLCLTYLIGVIFGIT